MDYDRNLRFTVSMLIAIFGTAIVLIVLGRHDYNRRKAECEARGGFYYSPRNGSICLNPNALK